MIEAGLYAMLAANSGVAAVVGARIFSMAAPPDLTQLPCLVYSFVGGAAVPTLTSRGVYRQRVQLDALAVSRDVAAQLRDAAIAAMDGWRQSLADGADVIETLVLNPGTDFADEERIFRCMAEFYVLYTPPGN